MKNKYRMYQRNTGVYYIQHNETGVQRSLGTTDKTEAQKLLDAENQTNQSAALNLELGKAYLRNADPNMVNRSWQEAMDELCTHGKETSRIRYERGMKAKEFDLIRDKAIIETTADDLRAVLKVGGSVTNNYLRRLHNLALENGWLHCQIIHSKKWPKSEKQPKRAITLQEHEKIIAAENNIERRHYYQMLWLIGAAQTDCSQLKGENFDMKKRVLSYQRMKTGEWSFLQIGAQLEQLLQELPKNGFIFPKIATLKDKDRSAEFCRRCGLLGIKGVSLHSYRYSWAERAYELGYAERFTQAALGHSSRIVHHAYARNAKVVCPSLEGFSPVRTMDTTEEIKPKKEETLEDGKLSEAA